MKKVISALIAAAVVLSVCIICVFAADTPTFSVNTDIGDRGDTVEVTLSVENVSASALTVQVSFDTDVLTATGGTLLQQVGMMKQINSADNANSRGLYDYSMFDMSDAVFTDGGLATLTFKVKDDAEYADTTLTVNVTAMQTAGTTVTEFDLNNGKVTVACLNHNTDGVDWTVTDPAECEETGTQVKYCTKCGAVAETDTIAALGHKYLNKYDEECANGCGTVRDESYKPVFTLTSDGGNRGEEVEVTLNVNNVLANALTVEVSFDKNVLEAVGSEELQTLGMMHSINDSDNANERGIFSYNMFAIDDTEVSDGGLAKFTFKIKEGATLGETDISVSNIVFGYSGGKVSFENCKTEGGKVCVHNTESVEWTEKTPATCEGTGVKEKYCSVCGELALTGVIDPIGHDYVGSVTTPATCEGSGVMTYVCNNDETHTYTEDIDPIGHSWGDWEETTAPKCEVDGEETRVCLNDETHVETRPVDAIGHSWGDWEETTAPDCENIGEETRVCLNDETHVETRPVDALGHNYDGAEWIVTLNPTWDTEGSKYRTCVRDDCGHDDVTAIPVATVLSVEITSGPSKLTYKVSSSGTEEFDTTGLVVTVTYSDWDVPTVITDFSEFNIPLVNVSEINPAKEFIFNIAGTELTVVLNIEGKFGDIDENGTVNIIDVQRLFVEVANGRGGEVPPAIADMSGEGIVNIIDVQKLFVAVANGQIS